MASSSSKAYHPNLLLKVIEEIGALYGIDAEFHLCDPQATGTGCATILKLGSDSETYKGFGDSIQDAELAAVVLAIERTELLSVTPSTGMSKYGYL